MADAPTGGGALGKPSATEKVSRHPKIDALKFGGQLIGRLALSLLIVLYPFLVYFGLMNFTPRAVALVLVAIALGRLLAERLYSPAIKQVSGSSIALLAASAVGVIYTLLSGSEMGLLFYPVLINVTLLILFSYSLLRPPSIIERLARLQEPELPDSGVLYTRKVTYVWCVFFLVNGSIAAVTITIGRDWWALYNGVIAYLLMGALFLAEWVIRQRVRKHA